MSEPKCPLAPRLIKRIAEAQLIKERLEISAGRRHWLVQRLPDREENIRRVNFGSLISSRLKSLLAFWQMYQVDSISVWKKCPLKERIWSCPVQPTNSCTKTLLGFYRGRSTIKQKQKDLSARSTPSPSLWPSRTFPWHTLAPISAKQGTYTRGKKCFKRKMLQSEVSTATKRLFTLGSSNIKAQGMIVQHKAM